MELIVGRIAPPSMQHLPSYTCAPQRAHQPPSAPAAVFTHNMVSQRKPLSSLRHPLDVLLLALAVRHVLTHAGGGGNDGSADLGDLSGTKPYSLQTPSTPIIIAALAMAALVAAVAQWYPATPSNRLSTRRAVLTRGSLPPPPPPLPSRLPTRYLCHVVAKAAVAAGWMPAYAPAEYFWGVGLVVVESVLLPLCCPVGLGARVALPALRAHVCQHVKGNLRYALWPTHSPWPRLLLRCLRRTLCVLQPEALPCGMHGRSTAGRKNEVLKSPGGCVTCNCPEPAAPCLAPFATTPSCR